jgi:prevent-host-death family protein
MQSWQIQQAKAKFSEVIDRAEKEGPQMITRRGVETAVIVPIDEWRRTQPAQKESLLDVLRAARFHELDIPPRGRLRHRKPIDLLDQ